MNILKVSFFLKPVNIQIESGERKDETPLKIKLVIEEWCLR